MDQTLMPHIRLPEGVVPVTPPRETRESPEDRDQRVAAALQARTDRWHRRVPSLFRDAALDDVTSEQDPDGKVRAWRERGGRNLILSGPTGVGKTHVAYAVGNDVVAQERVWAAAYFMPDLNRLLRPGGDEEALDVACQADYLVLDDLGREKITEWTEEMLTTILNTRNAEGRRTIITTNLDGPGVIERYGDPIGDRIRDDVWAVKVGGTPRRKPAPW